MGVSRRAVLLAGVSLAVLPSFAVQAADISKEARELIETLGVQAIGTINDDKLADADRREKFSKLLVDGFDIPAIARFCLGRYWRGATDEQKAAYQAAFQQMIIAVYATRFREYRGVAFSVVNSRSEGDDHAIVTSSLQPPTSSQAAKVEWRVLRPQGKPKVVDVIVEGVSMSLTQQQDFAAAMQSNGGDLDRFIAELKKRAVA
ncbi:phospholipid-binding protein MlaC [Elstera sp.]|jgi:phospholipid transport system substrate-binding protein|uniref:phospholipid-binding protein MlaC n=1 Tax=Elstera sp. TaxID=1916664 RepID=UPI0037BF4173